MIEDRWSVHRRALLVVLFASAVSVEAARNPAVSVVWGQMAGNRLGIMSGELTSKPNPNGPGTLVYVRRTQFSGAERFHVWLVAGGKVYALTAEAQGLTPVFLKPRDASETEWKKTGLSQKDPTEARKLAYGR